MQQEIADFVAGKHKWWHIQALKTTTYGDFGREYISDPYWEFVGGFDYKQDADAALAEIEKWIREGVQYGGDDYELRIVEKR